MIRIGIDTENSAFKLDKPEGWRPEVGWLLHDLADRVVAGHETPMVIRDFNGNTVGRLEQISSPAGEEAAA